jgi:5-methylcytosine-specific restriction endonuclease McrA
MTMWRYKAPQISRRQRYAAIIDHIRHHGPRCSYCDGELFKRADDSMDRRNERDPRFATIDHVLPRSRGGTNDPTNLVVCCGPCNRAKADRILRTSA